MNGTDNESLLAYRAYWFYLLNQGIIRAGTANSDSHSLVDNVLGTPRNIVVDRLSAWPASTRSRSTREVRAGHMVGTNGPVIEIATTDASGGHASALGRRRSSPASDGMLSIHVGPHRGCRSTRCASS